MWFLDWTLGSFKWWRHWRGGKWQLLHCADGFWDRLSDRGVITEPDFEDYTVRDAAKEP